MAIVIRIVGIGFLVVAMVAFRMFIEEIVSIFILVGLLKACLQLRVLGCEGGDIVVRRGAAEVEAKLGVDLSKSEGSIRRIID